MKRSQNMNHIKRYKNKRDEDKNKDAGRSRHKRHPDESRDPDF